MNETEEVARVTVGVVSSGQLTREVVVKLLFSDGSAISKCCSIKVICLRCGL